MRRRTNWFYQYWRCYFNPRPTYVRRPETEAALKDLLGISILAPRMWGDVKQLTDLFFARISILAPRMWGDSKTWQCKHNVKNFNPRPTYVRRRAEKAKILLGEGISILAPRMWGDHHLSTDNMLLCLFQSSPHVCEATIYKLLYKLRNKFQSSPHVCEATFSAYTNEYSSDIFQSSPHVCEATKRTDPK